MKKASKLLGLLLCCVMLLGLLPATAFAATSSGCDIPIEKIVEVIGETNPRGVNFQFALTPQDGATLEECGITLVQPTLVKDGDSTTYKGNLSVTVKVAQDQAAPDGAGWIEQRDGTFTLDCDLQEVNDSQAYWDYSLAEYTVRLIFDPTDNTLRAEIIDATAASFTNTYKYEENPSFEIPIEKTVKKGGNKAPGATAFTFELVDENGKTPADYGITMTNSTVATQGIGTFTGSLKGEISVNLANEQFGWKRSSENSPVYYVYFTLTEKNDGAARWTYSEEKYAVYIYYNTETMKASKDVCIYGNDASTTAAFTNIYTRNVSSTTNTTNTVESAKTADAGIALYAGLAILSMTGSAGVVLRRRKNDK